jgi:sugar (pentulose or hexulose) kinase
MKLIGLDVGTTGCKAIVFDAEGQVLGHGFREYGIICDAPAKAEQDAERVWTLAREALREAVVQAGGGGIRALSVSVQGDAIIPVDKDFRALHPAILGMDYRSAPQAAWCSKTLGEFALFEQTGMRPHPMNSLLKVMLLRDIAPKAFAQSAKIVTYADFILGKLGAEPVIDETMASRTMGLESDTRQWSESIHRAVGLEPAIWSRVVPSGAAVGTIRPSLAGELGLPPELLLAAGGHDQTCAALGAGAIREGPGVISTGTAEVLSAALDHPVLSRAMFESYYPCYRHAKPGMAFTFALNHVGGILMRWWRDNFAGPEVAEAAGRSMDPYQLIDERMPDGPSPVLFLPHLNGSGTPSCDLHSRGAIAGITLATTRHDVAKAILEGLTFELNLNLETLLACGIQIAELAAVGGGAKSPRWLQLKADILNRPLRTLRCREAACLGAAMLAGTAAGVYRDLDEAAAATVRYDREYAPDAGRVAVYAERYAAYKKLHPTLLPLYSTSK